MTNKTLQKLAKEWYKNLRKEISKTFFKTQQNFRKECPEFEHFLNNYNEKYKEEE